MSSGEMKSIDVTSAHADRDDSWAAIIEASNLTTRPLAAQLLQHMGLDNTRDQPFTLLDHACGSGATANIVHETISRHILDKSSVLSAEISPKMVEVVKARQAREGWVNSSARVLDAQGTDLPDASFSHITVGLALHMTPEPDLVLQDCIRVLQPGGVIGLTTPTRTTGGHMRDLQEAFATFPFDAPFPDPFPAQMHGRGRWWDHNWVRGHLGAQHGLEDVRVDLHARLIPYEGAAQFVRHLRGWLPYGLDRWWPEETRRAHPLDEVLELVRQFVNEKYGGGGWLSEFHTLVASGRKKAK